MNRIPNLAGVVLIAAALTACSSGTYINSHFNITRDNNGLVVHASGYPDAHVSRSGDLGIDGKAVAVTPTQRQLLRRYYREATDILVSGKTVGRQGVQIATHSIGAAIRSIFHGDSAAADAQLDAQSKQIEAAADKLCTDVKALGATQKALAAGIPAFAPYASGNPMQCTVTHTTTIKTDGTKSSSFTYSFKRDTGQNATTVKTSSPQPGHSTNATPSSQP